MKKIGLWKKLASWLLVFLLVLQIPVNVFAEGWISETNISADNDFAVTFAVPFFFPILSMMRK